MNHPASPHKIELFDIAIDNVTMTEAIVCIDRLVQQRRNAYVVTPSVRHVVRLQNDKPFKERVTGADMSSRCHSESARRLTLWPAR